MSDSVSPSGAERDPGPGRDWVREHGPGALLIRGGAGTGKSTALRERVVHLSSQGLEPSRIALITSTDRSAAAHRVRLEADLPGPYESLSVFTWEGLAE